MGWLKTFLLHFDALAGPIVTLLYPLFASIKAIESPSKRDDQQWLTYWVIYSFITLLEMTFWNLFFWFPFWGKIKFFAACWLVLPQFNGAAFVYDYFVRKRLFKQDSHGKVYHHLEKMMSPSTQSSVERFIEDHGLEAFENIISAANKEARKNKSSPSPTRHRMSLFSS